MQYTVREQPIKRRPAFTSCTLTQGRLAAAGAGLANEWLAQTLAITRPVMSSCCCTFDEIYGGKMPFDLSSHEPAYDCGRPVCDSWLAAGNSGKAAYKLILCWLAPVATVPTVNYAGLVLPCLTLCGLTGVRSP